MIQFALESIGFQLLFLLGYDLFLKKETFFQWNRAYLLGSFLLCLFLPGIQIEAISSLVTPPLQWLAASGPDTKGTLPEGIFKAAGFPWLTVVFFLGMFLAALLFCYKIYCIYRLKRGGEIARFPSYTLIQLQDSSLAFSFFRSVFIGDRFTNKEQAHIILHELVHLRQKHTLDLLFFEIMRIGFWCNPLVYLYQNRISELHEYIADGGIPAGSRDKQIRLMLRQVFESSHLSFLNHFNKTSFIKKRILMVQKAKSSPLLKLKYLLMLPILAGILTYTSCKPGQPETLVVTNVQHLTPEEERLMYASLKKHASGTGEWEFIVTDGQRTMRFLNASGDSYLSGPENEKIPARMILEEGDAAGPR